MRRRRVAIDCGMCRSGRRGSAAGSVTVGKDKRFDQPGGPGSRGGNRGPLGQQEAVCGDAQRAMVMEAAPAAGRQKKGPDRSGASSGAIVGV